MKTIFRNVILSAAKNLVRSFPRLNRGQDDKGVGSLGFTLIELIIVIGIIGILAGMIMLVLDPAKQLQKARDGQRKADLGQIQSALEFYRSDIGRYPTTSGTTYQLNSTTACMTSQSFTGTVGSNTITYLKKIPCDSKGTSYYNGGNYYYYSSDGKTYSLAACLENGSDTQGVSSAPSPAGSGSCSSNLYFIAYNP